MISKDKKIREPISEIYLSSNNYIITEMCNLLNHQNDSIKYNSVSFIGNQLSSNDQYIGEIIRN